ncbi:C40 family peptidase [Paenibacillus mucilaginosus]|uniref:NLP/P60 family protein n=1 Tax=Paenibacillus mucilaginosus (strain KNP414) TaxID=1036673 RepID=F8FE97_PAEMK|nr:C40 family peptidase [Paenibacillus mucilaginosus]AEI43856.1 NLP/P60 family protein [Paenibacillus mucilaginosus KNP414]MCG7212632.1 C40 family peptidase [Paenibacillus mucilaginosus]WDM25347.1 C40 family peptidase [Paenibacillus mucilaginosus]
MRMNKLVLGLLCSCMLVTGCSAGKSRMQSAEDERLLQDERITDGRMSDRTVLQRDEDQRVGDLGVEQLHRESRMRGSETGVRPYAAPLLDPNGFPLIRRYPDKSVLPIGGRYVENVIKAAKSYIGTPYVYGANRMDPRTFDCSSFTRWVFLYSLGMDLPWDSRSQAAYVKAFAKRKYTALSQARRGDLLFFTKFHGTRPSDYVKLTPAQKPVTHLGIYLGNGKIIHTASKETGGVRIDTIRGKHLEYRLVFGGGILD